MTFWLYHPRQIFKTSSILPYKSQDVGDFLNFLTIFLLSFSAYTKGKISDDIWKKIFVVGMLVIILLSLFDNSNESESETIEGLEMPKYTDYKFSLSVD